MACQGDCKVQLYDVDVTGVKVDVTVVGKADGTPVPSHIPGCPALSADEIADKLQPPSTKIEGCKDDECVCVPTDSNPTWTDWLTYNATGEIRKDDPGNPRNSCVYTFSGTYIVSSAVVSGVCMKKPAVPLPRPRSTKAKPKKQASRVHIGGEKVGKTGKAGKKSKKPLE